MNKKFLFFLAFIVIISLAYFAIADINEIIFNSPGDNDIIYGNYSFNATINGTAHNATFYYNSSGSWNLFCFNDTISGSIIYCENDTSLLEDGTYEFKLMAFENSSNASDENTGILIDNNAPLISLVSPANNSKSPITNVNFRYLPSDVLLDSCILYGDWNGNGQKNQSSNLTNNSENIFFHELSEGSYSWNISCNDTLGRTNVSSSYMFSLGVPTVSLVSPDPNYWTNQTSIVFNCSATDNSQLTNISLYGNWSGWHEEETRSVNGTSNSTTFTKNLDANKIYIWTCSATDNANQTNTAENRTLTIDTTLPTVTVYVSATSFYEDEDIDCNCSVSDNLDSNPTKTIGGRCSTNDIGDFGYTCTSCDNAGNCRTVNRTYEVSSAPTSSGDTTETGGGGGGATPTTVSVSDVGAISDEHCWDTIASGAIAEFDVNNTRIGIRKITIIPKSALTEPCLEAKQVISATAAGITLYTNSENVYKYFKITPTNIANTQLTSVLIEFSVSKTWLYNHKKETVALYRYYNGWNKLETEELSEDTDYVYFSAETPGFSSFVIIAEKISAETSNLSESCGNAICEVNEDSENCCQDCGCAQDFECKDNECKEVSSGFFITGWLSQIGDRLHVEWLGDDWLFGWPIWSFIVIGIFATFITLVIIFRKKLHLSLPFQIDFSIHKKPDYGFK